MHAPTPAQEPPTTPLAVELRGVEKIFPDGTRALAPIDLAIRDGEFVSIIGPSGCGKSTVLSLVANLDMPSAGRLRWWGHGFEAVGGDTRKLSVVFQDPTLMPWLRIDANVRLPLDLAHVPRAVADPRVRAALGSVGLEAKARFYPRQLSGGMKMRASIARSLVTDPNLLLMDEPFGALDEFTRDRLDADLNVLWHRRGTTVLFVTHSIQEAVFLSTRVVAMAARPGRIFQEIAIDAPHPRDPAFRASTRYADLCRALSSVLEQASRASPAEDR